MNKFIVTIGLLGGWAYVLTRIPVLIAFIDVQQLRIRITRECNRRGWPCEWKGMRAGAAYIQISGSMLILAPKPTFFTVPIKRLLDQHANTLAPRDQLGA